MHWTAAEPGQLDAERALTLIEQTPGEVVFLSAADTELYAVASIWKEQFGSRLRVASAFPLRQPVAADHYIEQVIKKARLVVARLLGGKAYFAHFLQGLSDLRDEDSRPQLLILSGSDLDESELAAISDFSGLVREKLFAMFRHGGRENIRQAGTAVELLLQERTSEIPEARPMPEFGFYRITPESRRQRAWICFYRAWFQTGDLAVIDALQTELERKGFQVLSFYSFSLRSPAAQAELQRSAELSPPDVILLAQSFSISAGGSDRLSFFEQLGCPVLQVPISLAARESWLTNQAGLAPAEVAMNAALPEVDGRILATVIGFKEQDFFIPEVEYRAKRLAPDLCQIEHVSTLALNWAQLRTVPNGAKKVAIVLSNYPNRDGRIGNGVGLDTPASVIRLLKALRDQGYLVDPCPESGKELMDWLQTGVTNDPENSYGKPYYQSVNQNELDQFIKSLPISRQNELSAQWSNHSTEPIPIPGIQLGNIFIGIQPPRGYSLDPQAIYHSPALPPPPAYLAFYLWIRRAFQAAAVVHVGKHGNLEWLPGRSIALGRDDYPLLCLGPMPLIYPFIVNNPGEGIQAKRRSSAAIIDHLTPPLTRAGLYDDLERVERLLEEHAHCLALYPSRAAELEKEIASLLSRVSWRDELPDASVRSVANYLCEIKESQIRSGLHVLGEKPAGEQEVDFLLSLLRLPSGGRPGLLQILAGNRAPETLTPAERDVLEADARRWIKANAGNAERQAPNTKRQSANTERQAPNVERHALDELATFVRDQLIPRLSRCDDEIKNVVNALNGDFVPPGPAGAPTRGRVDVLPTGRNFFAIDPRSVPTQTSWNCGKLLADRLLERFRQDHGEYPRKIALVIWGTSNMRTGGDDIAQALWLWGCEPVWEESSGRIVDFRILPLSLLGRPRVDLVLRVSGLFRDAFGDTMRLLATVPKRLAQQDESPEMNPIRASWLLERELLTNRGIDAAEASRRATLRVFSSGFGSYGTGLLPLIDAGNWESAEDLTEVFCRWGSYAFDSDGSADQDIALLKTQLAEIEVVHQNQDNREHDILDSDDYFQFQGGLMASIKQLRGTAPVVYHGDSSDPEQPRIRTLDQELSRVIRSRVLNPRWLEAMRRHGYKGAFEIAATVDYVFGYSATTGLVRDAQYEEIAQRLLLDGIQRDFFREHNPAALKESVRRLLEAAERGLWANPSEEAIAGLEESLLEIEGQLE
ncbi:MAG: cobaltochelatase subunit CobN [Verrucomicrobia bacterium]|nr:cobaltochelatase subunit CobN [Verrucomicrobiota bacterium]